MASFRAGFLERSDISLGVFLVPVDTLDLPEGEDCHFRQLEDHYPVEPLAFLSEDACLLDAILALGRMDHQGLDE